MAVRHAFQAELYGLTPAQRASGATAVNSALDGENVSEVSNRTVNPDYVKRGSTLLFVEVDFSTQGAGTRVFDTAFAWAASRAVDAPNGEHSYVRVRSVGAADGSIEQRVAQSPGWVTETTHEDSRP